MSSLEGHKIIKVHKKGVVTLPAHFRETLNISENDFLTASIVGKAIVLTKNEKIDTNIGFKKNLKDNIKLDSNDAKSYILKKIQSLKGE